MSTSTRLGIALDGPGQCSGLPVHRNDPSLLATLFGDGFTLLESFQRIHVTPWDIGQLSCMRCCNDEDTVHQTRSNRRARRAPEREAAAMTLAYPSPAGTEI